MSQVVCNQSHRGFINYGNDNYYTCRNTSVGTSITKDVDTNAVGQRYSTATFYDYYCNRAFIYFDTSGIPVNSIITSAIIAVGVSSDQSDTDFNIIIRGADSASTPIVLGDYDLTKYDGENLGQLTTAGVYTGLTLNSNGRAYINRGGITKFVLLSENDIKSVPPTGEEYIIYGSYTLTVIYFEPTEAPTVTTTDEACEDRQSTTLTAVGTVTSAGGGYTYRGFEYYEKGDDLEYDSSMWAVREIGTFVTTGVFRMTLNGLKPETTYYIRAFAGNVFGISYGEWIICSTTTVITSTYEIHTISNNPTISFYVSEDDGKTWSIRHGAYNADQSDIDITKIIVQGSGKKKIKFVTDAACSISASVMCKLDIKART